MKQKVSIELVQINHKIKKIVILTGLILYF